MSRRRQFAYLWVRAFGPYLAAPRLCQYVARGQAYLPLEELTPAQPSCISLAADVIPGYCDVVQCAMVSVPGNAEAGLFLT